MEGYLHLRIAPWLRRLITRLIALVPAVLVIGLTGEESTQQLLVLSQVILSLQLSFAVIPLIHFTSNRRNMGAFATPWWGQVLAWVVAAIIVALNGKLVFDQIVDVGRPGGASRGCGSGPFPLSWLVGSVLLGADRRRSRACWSGSRSSRWFGPRPPGRRRPACQLDWDEALRPRPLATDRRGPGAQPADAEILNRALSLAQADGGRPELVLAARRRYARSPASTAPRRPTGRPGPTPATSPSWSPTLRERGLLVPARSCSTAPTPPASSSATCGAIRSTCWSSARTATAWSATCSSARPWTGSATAWRSRC